MTTYDMSKAKAGDTFTKRGGVTDVYWKVLGVSFNGAILADAFKKGNDSFICFTTIEKRHGDSLWCNAVVYEPPKAQDRYFNIRINSNGIPCISGGYFTSETADDMACTTREGILKLTAKGKKISVVYQENTTSGDVS